VAEAPGEGGGGTACVFVEVDLEVLEKVRGEIPLKARRDVVERCGGCGCQGMRVGRGLWCLMQQTSV